MKCPSEVELNEFAEDRLDSRRRWEIQEHLDQCAGCRTDLEGLQWVSERLDAIDIAALSEGTVHPDEADLAALAEGSVSPEEKAELLSHLGMCAECARLFGALPRKSKHLSLPRGWSAFAAAAVLVICLGVFAVTGRFNNLTQHANIGAARPARIVAQTHTDKTPVPSKLAEAKPQPAPEEKLPAAVPAPQPTPAPVVAQNPAPSVAPTVVPAQKIATAPARPAMPSHHRVGSRRHGDGFNSMQVATVLPAEMPKPAVGVMKNAPILRSEAMTARGGTSEATAPHFPLAPAHVNLPGATAATHGGSAFHTMGVEGGKIATTVAVKPSADHTVAAVPAAPIQAAVEPAAPHHVAAPKAVAQHNDPVRKAESKTHGRKLRAAGAVGSGQALKRTAIVKSKDNKSMLKPVTGKCGQRSGHSRHVAHHHSSHHAHQQLAHANHPGSAQGPRHA